MQLYIVDLKFVLASSGGKEKVRLSEEIVNAQFELQQLLDKVIIVFFHCMPLFRSLPV